MFSGTFRCLSAFFVSLFVPQFKVFRAISFCRGAARAWCIFAHAAMRGDLHDVWRLHLFRDGAWAWGSLPLNRVVMTFQDPHIEGVNASTWMPESSQPHMSLQSLISALHCNVRQAPRPTPAVGFVSAFDDDDVCDDAPVGLHHHTTSPSVFLLACYPPPLYTLKKYSSI